MRLKINLILSFLLLSCSFVNAAVLPSLFAETRLAQKLDATLVKYSPDGKVFIVQKPGVISIVQAGSQTPLVCMDIRSKVDNVNERGAQSIAFDPDYTNNGFFYLYYTVKGANHNRVSRFKITGNVCDPTSEKILLDIDTLTGTVHNGGGMFFKDGKLFILTGDGANSYNSQSLTTLLGKVLRINKDGTIPSDNPFYWQTSGKYQAIYAMGLRNPYSGAINPLNGRVFINDVGKDAWEEVNELAAKANYGWPAIEGKRGTQTPPADYHDPVFVYGHTGSVCAIVGAAWYNPTTATFPSSYHGKYFYGDYCTSTIYVLDPTTYTVSTFATGASAIISFDVAPTGEFYYLTRGGGGEVYKIEFTNSNDPTFSYEPSDTLTTIGRDATFSVGTSGTRPLTYQWYRGSTLINGATSRTYTVSAPTLADDGTTFKVIVTNSEGSVESREALLTVTTNTPPVPTITTPVLGQKYNAGTYLEFAGTATDAEDGELVDKNFVWKIVFHHDDHTHPGLDLEQAMSGSYFLPSVHETSSNVWYRIYLTVTDNSGSSTMIYTEVMPNKANVTLATNPVGLRLKLDGAEVDTPYTFEGVVGITRILEAFKQDFGGTTYVLDNWSIGGSDAELTVLTPSQDQTITANFGEPGLSGGAIAGIAVGCVVFVGLTIGAYFYYKKRLRKRQTPARLPSASTLEAPTTNL